jgi:hypothetical protein
MSFIYCYNENVNICRGHYKEPYNNSKATTLIPTIASSSSWESKYVGLARLKGVSGFTGLHGHTRHGASLSSFKRKMKLLLLDLMLCGHVACS